MLTEMLVMFWIDAGEEKAKWGMCIAIGDGGVSFKETTNSSAGHHKLSNPHEESLYQGTMIVNINIYLYVCVTYVSYHATWKKNVMGV